MIASKATSPFVNFSGLPKRLLNQFASCPVFIAARPPVVGLQVPPLKDDMSIPEFCRATDSLITQFSLAYSGHKVTASEYRAPGSLFQRRSTVKLAPRLVLPWPRG